MSLGKCGAEDLLPFLPTRMRTGRSFADGGIWPEFAAGGRVHRLGLTDLKSNTAIGSRWLASESSLKRQC